MFPDNYPYTNFHELNLGYFIIHFREIFSQWADLYDQMLDWKDTTDEELATWKAGVEADLNQREATLRAELEAWKTQTGQDIAGWEDATLAALTAWQTATQAVFETIRVEAAGSATAAAASATDAATAKTAAETAQAAAEAAAASVTASAAQIATNTADISDLKTQLIPYVGENVAENMLRIEPPGCGKNLFNKYSVFNLYGGYHDRDNEWTANQNMMESHYIPVKESENYAFTHSAGGFVLWYKKDLSFLSYSNFAASDTYVTAPLNAAFMKTAFSTINVSGVPNANTMQVENGTVQTAYEEFIKNTSKYKAELIQTEYGIININDSDLLETDNLFDINADNILNGYYDRTNSFVSSGTLGQTDFIKVFENYEYSFATTGTFVLWYDGQKNYITYTNITDTTQKVIPPARAKYVRGIFFIANISSYWVKCEKIKRIKANYTNPFKGLKGVAFGTSLTYRAETTGGYLQYLPGLSEMTWDNQGLGSATILDNGTRPKMLPVITGYTNWSDKNICILEGFVNDWYYNGAELGTWKDTGTTTVCGCVRYALNYILTQNANLTVYLVMDHFGKGITATTAVNGAGDTQLEFYEEIEKVALSLGIRVIREYEISEISELTPQFLLDNIHLNDLGAKQSANAIWSGMKKYYPNEES